MKASVGCEPRILTACPGKGQAYSARHEGWRGQPLLLSPGLPDLALDRTTKAEVWGWGLLSQACSLLILPWPPQAVTQAEGRAQEAPRQPCGRKLV